MAKKSNAPPVHDSAATVEPTVIDATAQVMEVQRHEAQDSVPSSLTLAVEPPPPDEAKKARGQLVERQLAGQPYNGALLRAEAATWDKMVVRGVFEIGWRLAAIADVEGTPVAIDFATDTLGIGRTQVLNYIAVADLHALHPALVDKVGDIGIKKFRELARLPEADIDEAVLRGAIGGIPLTEVWKTSHVQLKAEVVKVTKAKEEAEATAVKLKEKADALENQVAVQNARISALTDPRRANDEPLLRDVDNARLAAMEALRQLGLVMDRVAMRVAETVELPEDDARRPSAELVEATLGVGRQLESQAAHEHLRFQRLCKDDAQLRGAYNRMVARAEELGQEFDVSVDRVLIDAAPRRSRLDGKK